MISPKNTIYVKMYTTQTKPFILAPATVPFLSYLIHFTSRLLKHPLNIKFKVSH